MQLQQGDKPIRAIKMKKAIPAELIQIPVKYQELVQGEALKVVMMYD